MAVALACGLVALMVSRGGMLLLEHRAAFASWGIRDQNLLRMICGLVAGMALGLSRPGILVFTPMFCLLTWWIVKPERRRFVRGAAFISACCSPAIRNCWW